MTLKQFREEQWITARDYLLIVSDRPTTDQDIRIAWEADYVYMRDEVEW